ncbi:helix-turn-helix domain-containing protein [Chitinophaga qingshengii]|uniref:Helix-turn-helix transcriptional regulator n=1 Tax=Chitinophaga qingshengii TaxID=1569794 RepID=A0ABR7TVB0_9BACT|nr:AraC family transcriptional regulator [Chitinophaga qingshengii]MBC9934426.1 helix-turn-helix transcriptional regulator [Chitinophaga qingshengii]
MIKRALKQTFTLLNVDHVKLDSGWNYSNVISPYFRIYYIDAGAGEIWDASAKVRLESGFLYIIPSFTLCNLICPDYLSQYFVQFFEESSDGISLFENNRVIMKVKATEMDILNFRRLLEINPGRGINRSDNPKVYEKNIFYKEYQELNNRQSLSTFTETHGILLQLVSRFLTQQTFKHRDTGHVPVKILNIISYIQLNLNRDLSVTLLAEKANLHTDYFSRLFQRHTGERPVKYVHEKRIERAQYLMLTSRMTFTEIAAQTGFDNVFYFSKIFKKITGVSPGAYKKQMNTIGF